jgi:NAD(P)-dependent dehydrogenase (short-subunit alcohol dehydrogenase family)
MPGGAIPDIARAGANALVRSLAIELAPHGIAVNAIAPNFLYSEAYFPRARYIDDPAGRDWIRRVVPAGRLGEPAEIGALVRHLATLEGSFHTGTIIPFTGGWPAAPPRPD